MRFFADVIRVQHELLFGEQPRLVQIPLDYSALRETGLLHLGYEMRLQFQRILKAAVGLHLTFEAALEQVREVHVVGFSMGNIVAESLIA